MKPIPLHSKRFNVTAQLVVAREVAGLSQRDLAREAGVSKSRIQRIETGGWSSTPAGELSSVCRCLNVNPLIVMSDFPTIRDHLTTQVNAVFQVASWEALQETLGDFVSAVRPARPDLGAVAMTIRGHIAPQGWHIYHSSRIRVSEETQVPDDNEFNALNEKLRSGKSIRTESIAGEHSPGWHLVDYPRTWYIHRQSSHGILSLCFERDPDRIGDAEALTEALLRAVDTGMDRLMVLRQRSEEGQLRRHELRLRELERDMAQLKFKIPISRADPTAHTNGNYG